MSTKVGVVVIGIGRRYVCGAPTPNSKGYECANTFEGGVRNTAPCSSTCCISDVLCTPAEKKIEEEVGTECKHEIMSNAISNSNGLVASARESGYEERGGKL